MNKDAPSIPTPAPPTREALMIEHTLARRRRDSAPLGSEAYQKALIEIARIEVAIAGAENVQPGEPPIPPAPGARPRAARTGSAHS